MRNITYTVLMVREKHKDSVEWLFYMKRHTAAKNFGKSL